jgi:cell division protease FtsH
MSDKLGPRTFGNKQEMVFLGREIAEQRDYGDKIANLIDEEVHKIITLAYETAKDILVKNMQRLTHISEKLIVQETLEGEELELIFNEPVTTTQPESIAKPTPAPVKAKNKIKPVPRKAPGIARQPKQFPATP